MLPVADDAEPLELLSLDVDVFLRVLAAAANLLERVHGPPHVSIRGVEPELLVHLMLDGQAVAVPARNVDGVVPQHGARLHDEVLQDLVECRPHVDIAVGIGRTVVEDPQGTIGRGLPNAAVDVHLVPAREHVGLELGQIGLHGKGSLRKVECVLVVHRGRNVTPMRV